MQGRLSLVLSKSCVHILCTHCCKHDIHAMNVYKKNEMAQKDNHIC